jgi:hypothetical protein
MLESESLLLWEIQHWRGWLSANRIAARVDIIEVSVPTYSFFRQYHELSLFAEQICSVLSRATIEWLVYPKHRYENEVHHKNEVCSSKVRVHVSA